MTTLGLIVSGIFGGYVGYLGFPFITYQFWILNALFIAIYFIGRASNG